MKFERKFNPTIWIVLLIFAVITMIGAGLFTPAAAATLTKAEAEMLTFMREEEKLAHDVYLVMYERWGAVIFSSILASEQRHMETMLKMLNKYGLSDPAAGRGIGEFANAEIQGLYDALIAQGNVSLIDALHVGVEIENTDIFDIQNALAGTSRKDLRTAYTNLLEGSFNHLQAFEKAIEVQGQ